MSPDVIVVGAGFAGLSAAVALAGDGARVLVLEARPGLGGRATAFTDPRTGERVDNGQHALFGCYHETFHFLDAIGAAGDVRLDPRLELHIVDSTGNRSRLATMTAPPPWHLVGGLLRWNALGLRDRLAALRLGAGLRSAARGRGAGRPGEGETVAAWLKRHGQTPTITTLLWEPLAVAALNQPAEVASAGPFVTVLARMFGGTRRDAAIGLALKPLDELYAMPARRFIEARGGEVRTLSPARLDCDRQHVTGVTVRGTRIAAGAVVSAAPWHAMPALAGHVPALGDLVASATSMASAPIVTANLWFDRAVLDAPLVGLPGRTWQWVFDKGRVFGRGASHLSLVSSGAEAVVGRSNAALVQLALDELRAAVPRARAAALGSATIVRERRATFSLAPGQPRRPGAQTPLHHFVLAGDWIDTGLPATIESAVVSGHAAARLAARPA